MLCLTHLSEITIENLIGLGLQTEGKVEFESQIGWIANDQVSKNFPTSVVSLHLVVGFSEIHLNFKILTTSEELFKNFLIEVNSDFIVALSHREVSLVHKWVIHVWIGFL